MKIGSIASVFVLSLFLVACGGAEKSEEATEETAEAEATEEATSDEGWIVLFDGTSTDGWRGYGKEELPSDWQVTDNGELYMAGSGRGEAGSENGGDMTENSAISISALNGRFQKKGTREFST